MPGKPVKDRRHHIFGGSDVGETVAFGRESKGATANCRDISHAALAEPNVLSERQSQTPRAVDVLRNFAAADTSHPFARPIERIEPCHARTPSRAVTERRAPLG